MTNSKNLKKGFTLTELIIVIVIIGILAAVLIPSLSSYINKAKKSAAEQNALTIHKEYMATVDNELYDDVAKLSYVVEVDKYYVVIEKGALVKSLEKSKVECTKLQAENYSIKTITDGKKEEGTTESVPYYVYLSGKAEFSKTTNDTDGTVMRAVLCTLD